MPLIRLLLLLLVLASLTILLVQNWYPVLPLVFLGMRTQAFPLALWILICFTAGAFTSLLLAILFRLSYYFAATQPSRQRYVKATQKTTRDTQRSESSSSQANRSPSNNAGSNYSSVSDWDSETTDDDDWDVDSANEKQEEAAEFQSSGAKSTTYERSQQPQSSSQTGSVYSYSYQEPRSSGVGKTESVYDADYRVITPPYQPTNTAKPKEEEDWGFEDDDEE